jgi:hypothetical protein
MNGQRPSRAQFGHRYVRSWHETDIDPAMVDVGHRGQSGHPVAVPPRRPLTHLGHQAAGDFLLWSLCSAKQTPLFFRRGTSYKTAQMSLLLGDAEQ